MLNIHTATTADLDALQAIGCQTYREHFSTLWSPAGLQAFLERDFSTHALRQSVESADSQMWLLASNEHEQVVGFAKVNWSTSLPVTGEAGVELRKIYFLKSAAGLGYGKQLLQCICDQATERAESLLWLTVLKSNANARRFYEAFGFQATGEIPFKTDLAEIGMDVMTLELDKPGK